MMSLVDLFVERLNLPRPNGQICSAWTARLPPASVALHTPPSSPEGGVKGSPWKKKPKHKHRHATRFTQLVAMLQTHNFNRLLAQHKCMFECQCCAFERPVHYMAACLEMTYIEVKEVPQFIAHLSAVMAFNEEDVTASHERTEGLVGCKLASARDVSMTR